MAVRPYRLCLTGALMTSLLIMPIATTPAWSARPKVDAAWREDNCKLYRQPLTDIRKQILGDTAMGAAKGALIAVLAARAGHASTATTMFAGVLGGIAGAVIGNIKAKKDAGLDRQSLNTYVDGEFGPRMSPYQHISDQILDLGNCRRGQLFSIQQDLEAQRIGKDQAQLRYQAVMSWLQEDDKTVASLLQGQRERVSAYAQSYAYANGSTEDQVRDPAATLDVVATTVNASAAEDEIVVNEVGEAPPPPAPPLPEQRYIAAKTGAPLRTAPSPKAKQLALVPRGEVVTIVAGQTAGDWSQVQWTGKQGYIFAQNLGTSAPPVIKKAADPTEIGAGKKGAKVIRMRPPATRPASPSSPVQAAIVSQHDAQRAQSVDKSATAAQASALLDRIRAAA